MSDDTPPEPSGDGNRLATDGEVEELEKQFESTTRVGAPPYVALPADGHDVHGLWHCFNAGSRSGYTAHAIGLHWTLDRLLKVPTQLIPHRGLDIDIDQFPEDRYDMLFGWHARAVGHGHVVFSSFPPEVSTELSQIGPPLVPYIAFEGTKVSAAVRNLCNGGAFRKVWVVHPFVRDALVAGGVEESRVRVVPPLLVGGPWSEEEMFPYRHEMEEYAATIHAAPATPDLPFTFGAMGTWHERKGFPDLVRAYFSTFRRADPVQLVIRTSAFGGHRTIRDLKEELTGEIAAIAAELGDYDFPKSKKQPRLRLLLGTGATDREIIEWLGSLDCYVSPSYGEGLGIPFLWAKAQGVPAIGTGFGAVGQTLNDIASAGGTSDEIIDYELTPVDPAMLKVGLMFGRDTQWGRYEVPDLGHAMELRFARGRAVDIVGQQVVRDTYGPDNVTAQVKSGLEELVDAQLLQDWGLT